MEADEIFQVEKRFESPLTVTRVERLCLPSTITTYEQIYDDENEGTGEEDEEVEDFEDGDDENELFYSEEEFEDEDDGDGCLGLGKSTAYVLVSIGRIWIICGPGSMTMYKWHSQENGNIFNAFKCVLKDRYRDRMKRNRIKSGDMAQNDEKPIPPDHSTYFEGMHNYRPKRVPENVWLRLCDHWSTDKWRNNSKIAQQNRKTADANGSTTRHTTGSIGFHEHCNNLEKLKGKPPTQYDVFMKTHGTTESKKNIFTGDHENLEYCSQAAKKAHVDRLRAQVSTMEQQQQQMKEQMEMVIRMMNMSGHQPHAPPDNPPEDN
ncbi:unnamed protein product [Lactuca virosa]|uniref:Transposase, Ptta/En/Spm, plant n=1 Tax=Lactuca virosa TaxID=75947 RepID=A0AAU9M2G0_9ASTR|nr:unnamed protein product [Lactuca virosa]